MVLSVTLSALDVAILNSDKSLYRASVVVLVVVVEWEISELVTVEELEIPRLVAVERSVMVISELLLAEELELGL